MSTTTITFDDIQVGDTVRFTNTQSAIGSGRNPRSGSVAAKTPTRITVKCVDGSRAYLTPANTPRRNVHLFVQASSEQPTDAQQAIKILHFTGASRAAAQHLRALATAQEAGDTTRMRIHFRDAHRVLSRAFNDPNRVALTGIDTFISQSVLPDRTPERIMAYVEATHDISAELNPSGEPTDWWRITDPNGTYLGDVHSPDSAKIGAAVRANFGAAVDHGFNRRRLSADEI